MVKDMCFRNFRILLLLCIVFAACSSDASEVLTNKDALSLIEKGQVTEVHLSASSVEMKSADGTKFVTAIGSDATRLLFVKTIETVNAEGGRIKLTESEAGEGQFYLFLLNILPFVLLVAGLVTPVLLFLMYRELKRRNDNAEKRQQ